MTDVLQLVSEEDRRALLVLSQLSDNALQYVCLFQGMICIWTQVSAFIERQMTLKKGVHLAGLGTFTFSQQKLDIGNNFKMIQRPIFLPAGKLVHSRGLKQTTPLAAATHLPVVQLNFTAVSQETPFSRDTVEGCVRETLLLLFRALATEKNVFLTFKGIGVLSFKNNKVQMKFNRDFINGLDGTGTLPLAFNKRPESSASLLPSGLFRLEGPQTANPVTLPTVCAPRTDNKARDKDGWCSSPASDQMNAGEDPQLRESKSHQTLQPAKVKAVSLKSEAPNPKPPVEARDRTISSKLPQEVLLKLEEHLVNVNCSGHARAGQELCYLCMQRAQRNVPVYLRAQQQADERAQEKLLLLKQQVRDEQYMEEEQAKLREQHAGAKQLAAINLQMSAIKTLTHFPVNPNSFIFPARPLTPPRSIQQGRYMNDIQSQIERRRKFKAQDEQNRLLMDCVDQIQLIQDIALQKAQQLQQKQEQTKHYKRALDTQVEDKKSAQPPDCHPDNSTFSRCETAACNTESRERAQKIFQVNFSAATKKKEELHNHQAELEKEREMLRHNKMELIRDRIKRFEKMRDISKSLEQEWSSSVKHKRKQEEDERRFLRSAGQLLVDKLAEYKRCCQCERRTTNCGETNIWKDSHYPSGSKFMI